MFASTLVETTSPIGYQHWHQFLRNQLMSLLLKITLVDAPFAKPQLSLWLCIVNLPMMQCALQDGQAFGWVIVLSCILPLVQMAVVRLCPAQGPACKISVPLHSSSAMELVDIAIITTISTVSG
jgi:hypothetical protein